MIPTMGGPRISTGPGTTRPFAPVRLLGGLLGGVVVLLIATACQTPRPARDFVAPGQPLSVDDARADRVVSAHRDAVARRTGLRGAARVALSGPDFKLNRPQRIALERPSRLRFEILGLFDQLAAILATDGSEYGFYDASTGEIARGRVTARLLADLTQIDLAPEEVVALLLGAPEPDLGTRRAGAWLEPSGRIAIAFSWPEDDDAVGCQGDDPWGVFFSRSCFVAAGPLLERGGQLFFFDSEGRLAELRVIDPGGATRIRALFEEYTTIEGQGGVNFPKRVTLQSPIAGSEARFEWKRVMLASDLSDRLFELPEPARSGPGS